MKADLSIREKTTGTWFPAWELNENTPEFLDLDENWLKTAGCTHFIKSGYMRALSSDYRGAIIKKTVAYILIDEDDAGRPVFEKWNLK